MTMKTTAGPASAMVPVRPKRAKAVLGLAQVAVNPAIASADVPAPPIQLKKKELVDRVAARAGLSRNAARPVVEAMLAELGAALATGGDMNLPPFGKFRIVREKDAAKGRTFVVRIRQPGNMGTAAENGDG